MADATSGKQGPTTVVLVHGAFADAGSWAGVTQRLIAAGVSVRAIVNPLRGLSLDAAYVASFIKQTPGKVLAVGHSYGGAVLTNAVPQTNNVVGLVYVAAFAPDEGQALGEIVGSSKESLLLPAIQELEYPTGKSETAKEVVIDPKKFHAVFTADLPQLQSDVLANSQRPIAAAAFAEKSGSPAWKKLPSWAAVAKSDKAIGADAVRAMAKHAGADITEIEGSHVVMISQPDAVTRVIQKALKAVGG
jgi:pimeloyl-ACP methyl ester carboxylesterase